MKLKSNLWVYMYNQLPVHLGVNIIWDFDSKNGCNLISFTAVLKYGGIVAGNKLQGAPKCCSLYSMFA